jgi:hypothetical protein
VRSPLALAVPEEKPLLLLLLWGGRRGWRLKNVGRAVLGLVQKWFLRGVCMGVGMTAVMLPRLRLAGARRAPFQPFALDVHQPFQKGKHVHVGRGRRRGLPRGRVLPRPPVLDVVVRRVQEGVGPPTSGL